MSLHGDGPRRAGREVRRAVLIAPELAPRVSGRATAARSLAAGLSASGIDVRVYAATHFGPEISDLPAGAVRRLYPPGADPWSDLLVTLDALVVDAPDVIHLCDAEVAPWVPALRAAFPAAITVDVHGEDPSAPGARHGGDPSAYRAAQIAGLGAADAVLAASASAARAAAAAGVPRAGIEVIESDVDGARFAPGPGGPAGAALAARLGIRPDDEVVLAVSRLAPHKGHAGVLMALAEVLPRRPKALYVYTGDDALLSTELATLANELGVRGRVRAAGLVDDADLPALYRLARLFVRLTDEGSSDARGSGMALLEAAASGLPVVVTRADGAPEAVEDGSTGLLVPPGDALAAARALEVLLADPARARAMGARARARALACSQAGARAGWIVDRWNALVCQVREAGHDGGDPQTPGPAGHDGGDPQTPGPAGHDGGDPQTPGPAGHDGGDPQTPGPAGLEPLRGFAAAFAGGPSKVASAKATAVREALAQVTSGADLLRLARADAIARERAASQRRARFAKIVRKGGVAQLRAVGSGAPLLPEALSDCAALGHSPFVETSLCLFAAPDFQAHALPRIRGAILVHGVPAEGARALLARLLSLPAGAFSKVDSLRLVLPSEARASPRLVLAAVAEAQALLRFFADRRVTVVPPPELAPRLQADFGPRARDAKQYEDTLCSDHAPLAWVPDTLQQALLDQARLAPGERPLVVDFGCGVAVALLGLVAIASRCGVEIDALGLDRGYDGPLHGDFFPGDDDLMRRIVARHGARIGALGRARFPSIRRGDLERDPWPLAEGTVALAASRTAAMYLSDKLGFVERVYQSLREGGVALIHLDELQPGTRQLRRIRLPQASIDDLLAEQRSRGVEIHGQGSFVIAMRRSATPLVFPWKLERAYPMEELLGPEEPWGTVARYQRHGPPPDGIYRNVTVEGRAVPLIRVKEGGSMVLVDTDGRRPVTWREQFKRHGSIAYGTYNIHRTNVTGSHAFADSPVDRTGHWIIDGKGNIRAAEGKPPDLRGSERGV